MTKIMFKNVNTNKLHDELIRGGVTPILVESKDADTWITVEDNQVIATNTIASKHNPNPIPKEQRELAYTTMREKVDKTPLLVWESRNCTVDEANRTFMEYFAEGNAKADQIKALITSAKNYIRGLYPYA